MKTVLIFLAVSFGMSPSKIMAEEPKGEIEKVKVDPELFKTSGGTIETAAPGSIERTLVLSGEVRLDADHSAKVATRFNGVVKEVLVSVGSPVKKGQVLATVESNESLATFQIVAPVSGQVLERHVSPGEAARDDKEVFVVADLNHVWVDMVGYTHDLPELSIGQTVSLNVSGQSAGKITFISPQLQGRSRSAIVRVAFDNTQKLLKPGSFVKAKVTTSKVSSAIAVKRSALQTIEGRLSIFVPVDDHFETRNIIVGKMDEEYAEIVSGVKAGDLYVADGSIRLKSELLKAADDDD